MHLLLLAFAFAVCAKAGTIQGVVLEHASGRPLARTVVRLDPVPKASGSTGQSITTRTGRSGQFVFPAVAPGSYVLVGVRYGYFPGAYGQRLPAGHGTPIHVTADSTLFAELRLRHKGALTGRVLDENGVGTAGVPVMAYRARLPLRSAGGATSDDRGVFRIYGLEPGKYWVRSGGHTLEDKTGWLPTFGLQSREVRNAHVHKVTVDTDTPFADVSPEPGQLFSVGGAITCEILGRVLVTLSSDTGQRRSETGCPGGYGFDGLAPGVYELFATLENDAASGFLEVNLGGSLKVDLSLMASPTVDFEVRRAGSDGNTDVPLTLTGRRQDLSETEAVRQIKGPRTTLTPGYWELRAQLPPGWYVDSIANQRSAFRSRRKAQHAPDWYEVFIETRVPARIRINVSDQAGQIAGRVIAEGKPVPGAPVFLWPVAESARRSLGGPPKLLSDTEGNFRFTSLPPGDYRLLASFDVNEVDEESIEASRAPLVRAEALKTATIDLPLWVAPY